MRSGWIFGLRIERTFLIYIGKYVCIVDKTIDQVWLTDTEKHHLSSYNLHEINTRWQEGRQKCLLVAKETFRVVPSIISAGRKPISLISTHLSLIIHCIRKRIPSPTRSILFQVTRIINMLRASTYSKTQNEEEQVDREISSCRYGATTASLSVSLSLSTGLGSTDYWHEDK